MWRLNGYLCCLFQQSACKVQILDGKNEWWPGMIEVARPTLEFSCDVKVVMGFMCIMSMLEVVYDLIKFVQKKIHICVILWEWWKCVVHICTHCIAIQRRNTLTNNSRVLQILLIATMMSCSQLDGLMQPPTLSMLFFISKANNTKSILSAPHQGFLLCVLMMLGLMLQKEWKSNVRL